MGLANNKTANMVKTFYVFKYRFFLQKLRTVVGQINSEKTEGRLLELCIYRIG